MLSLIGVPKFTQIHHIDHLDEMQYDDETHHIEVTHGSEVHDFIFHHGIDVATAAIRRKQVRQHYHVEQCEPCSCNVFPHVFGCSKCQWQLIHPPPSLRETPTGSGVTLTGTVLKNASMLIL